MRYQRDTDELTDLYNRRGFYAQMDRLTLQPDTLGYGALALIDADGLKAANDTYGHKQGDQYLCAIAGILKSFPQEHIVAARLGGDEFVAFFHSYSTKDELEKAVQVLAGQSERLSIQLSPAAYWYQSSIPSATLTIPRKIPIIMRCCEWQMSACTRTSGCAKGFPVPLSLQLHRPGQRSKNC